jgi:uncharacterized protein
MPEMTPRVVFDCNIYVQALLNPQGTSGSCKRLVDNGEVILFLSNSILNEITEVVNRPKIRALVPSLTMERVESFLVEIQAKAVLIKNVPERFTYERDPEDEPYINLAVEAKADYIVSRDNDLLDLMTGHTPECKEFRQRFRPLKVIDPLAFLKLVTLAEKQS